MLKDKNYGSNPKKYRRASKNGLVSPLNTDYVNRLNNLVTNPVIPKESELINIAGIESTNDDVVGINSNDNTLNTLEYELAFLKKTLENIYSLKKSEKFLKQRLTVLVKCLNQLKSIQDSVNQVGLVIGSNPNYELTNLSKPATIDIVEDEAVPKSTKLAQLTISVADELVAKPSANIQDFE